MYVIAVLRYFTRIKIIVEKKCTAYRAQFHTHTTQNSNIYYNCRNQCHFVSCVSNRFRLSCNLREFNFKLAKYQIFNCSYLLNIFELKPLEAISASINTIRYRTIAYPSAIVITPINHGIGSFCNSLHERLIFLYCWLYIASVKRKARTPNTNIMRIQSEAVVQITIIACGLLFIKKDRL